MLTNGFVNPMFDEKNSVNNNINQPNNQINNNPNLNLQFVSNNITS